MAKPQDVDKSDLKASREFDKYTNLTKIEQLWIQR